MGGGRGGTAGARSLIGVDVGMRTSATWPRSNTARASRIRGLGVSARGMEPGGGTATIRHAELCAAAGQPRPGDSAGERSLDVGLASRTSRDISKSNEQICPIVGYAGRAPEGKRPLARRRRHLRWGCSLTRSGQGFRSGALPSNKRTRAHRKAVPGCARSPS